MTYEELFKEVVMLREQVDHAIKHMIPRADQHGCATAAFKVTLEKLDEIIKKTGTKYTVTEVKP